MPHGLCVEQLREGFHADVVLLAYEPHVLFGLLEVAFGDAEFCLGFGKVVVSLCQFELHLLCEVLLFCLSYLVACLGGTDFVDTFAKCDDRHLAVSSVQTVTNIVATNPENPFVSLLLFYHSHSIVEGGFDEMS